MKQIINNLKKQKTALKFKVKTRETLFNAEAYNWQASEKGVQQKTNTEIIQQQVEELECIIENLENLEQE